MLLMVTRTFLYNLHKQTTLIKHLTLFLIQNKIIQKHINLILLHYYMGKDVKLMMKKKNINYSYNWLRILSFNN